MGPRGHLRVSNSYHKEGKSRQRWWGSGRTGVSSTHLPPPDAHSFALTADSVCTHAPLPRR